MLVSAVIVDPSKLKVCTETNSKKNKCFYNIFPVKLRVKESLVDAARKVQGQCYFKERYEEETGQTFFEELS